MAKFTNNLMFGYFAVIQTLVYFVDALVNFQSWQAVTRFAHVLNCNDRKRLYNLCFKVDFITAMMAFVICNIITYFSQNISEYQVNYTGSV